MAWKCSNKQKGYRVQCDPLFLFLNEALLRVCWKIQPYFIVWQRDAILKIYCRIDKGRGWKKS